MTDCARCAMHAASVETKRRSGLTSLPVKEAGTVATQRKARLLFKLGDRATTSGNPSITASSENLFT